MHLVPWAAFRFKRQTRVLAIVLLLLLRCTASNAEPCFVLAIRIVIGATETGDNCTGGAVLLDAISKVNINYCT